MKIIRWLLGRLILTLNFIFAPKKRKRTLEQQQTVDQETQGLQLYQFQACPFCVKVRWAMQRNSLNVATKDAKRNPQFAKELVEGGGNLKVPCLRIEENDGAVTWMYESSDIIDYLEQRFELVPAS